MAAVCAGSGNLRAISLLRKVHATPVIAPSSSTPFRPASLLADPVQGTTLFGVQQVCENISIADLFPFLFSLAGSAACVCRRFSFSLPSGPFQ